MKRIIGILVCSTLAGCVGTPTDVAGEPPASSAAAPAAPGPSDSSAPASIDDTGPLPARDPGEAAGYVHSLAASRFRVGDGPRGLSEAAWYKIVGSEGVFATDPHTGAVRANPNGDAPAVRAPALTTSADAHNTRVLAYFRAAGLPMAQVGGAHVTTIMKVEGPAATAGAQRPTFVAYTTIVERTIDGIRVPDSFAWARFNARDEVVAEGVYWPTIPAAAIAAARGLRDQLADPTRGAAFRGLLGVPETSAQGGLVTIRHSGAVSRGAFDAFAAYDVHVPYGDGMTGRGRTVHFDVNGRARALPVDDPAAPVTRDTPK